MNKNLKKQLTIAPIAAIAATVTACTDGGNTTGAGIVVDPPAIAEDISSSSIDEIESSSSAKPTSSSSLKSSSSSYTPPILCKPGVPNEFGKIGCAIINPKGDYTWDPTDYSDGTRFDELGDNVGYWYEVNDNDDGGKSTIKWPTEKGNTDGHDNYNYIIDTCIGLCGTVVFDKGSLTSPPFVGIGFGVGEPIEGEKDKFKPKDISNWKEICILSYSNASMTASLILTDSLENIIRFDNFKAILQKGSVSEKCISFSPTKFTQDGWGDTLSFDNVLKNVTAIQFTISGETNKQYQFNIEGIAINLKDDE